MGQLTEIESKLRNESMSRQELEEENAKLYKELDALTAENKRLQGQQANLQGFEKEQQSLQDQLASSEQQILILANLKTETENELASKEQELIQLRHENADLKEVFLHQQAELKELKLNGVANTNGNDSDSLRTKLAAAEDNHKDELIKLNREILRLTKALNVAEESRIAATGAGSPLARVQSYAADYDDARNKKLSLDLLTAQKELEITKDQLYAARDELRKINAANRNIGTVYAMVPNPVYLAKNGSGSASSGGSTDGVVVVRDTKSSVPVSVAPSRAFLSPRLSPRLSFIAPRSAPPRTSNIYNIATGSSSSIPFVPPPQQTLYATPSTIYKQNSNNTHSPKEFVISAAAKMGSPINLGSPIGGTGSSPSRV